MISPCPNWKIQHDVYDAHDGQLDARVLAFHPETGERVGWLNYAFFQGKAYIAGVSTEKKWRRCGIARALITVLVQEYGWKKLDWGWLTDEGRKLKRALRREFTGRRKQCVT